MYLKKLLQLSALVALLSNACLALAYTSISVFGDSTNDGGNDPTAVISFYKLFGDPFPPNAGVTPVPFENFRYSDGLVSSENMAISLGLFNTNSFFNFSVGGALALDFNDKINTIYADPQYQIDPTGLYVIELGQVDLDRNLSTPEISSTNVVSGIQNLYNRGARHFVVYGTFHLGDLPGYINADPFLISEANRISNEFNVSLIQKIAVLPFSDKVLFFDNGKYLRNIQLNPSDYGITNTTKACIISTLTGEYCSNRESYIFWDTVHLTGRAQTFLGQLLADTVTFPNISLVSPSNNATATLNSTVALSANAKDGDGNITKVEFYEGETLIGTDTTSPYSFSWTPTTAGQKNISAKAYDNDNRSTVSNLTTLTVTAPVNQAPSILLNTPITSNGGSEGSITAIATDTDGTISRVEFYVNGNLFETRTNAPYTLSWNNAPNGNYTLTAKAFDDQNASAMSAPVAIIVNTTANRAPTVSLNAPISNNGNLDGAITASANDADGAITKVEFYVNDALFTTINNAPYTVTWGNAPVGIYATYAKAYDNKNATAISNTVMIEVSPINNPPSITLAPPIASNGNSQGSITASASDSDGTISKVEFYVNGNLFNTLTSAPYKLSWSDAPNGTYAVNARAYDNANSSTTSNSQTVIINR